MRSPDGWFNPWKVRLTKKDESWCVGILIKLKTFVMWNEKFIEKLHLPLRCWLRWCTESRPRRGRRRHQRPLEDTKSRSADLFNELTLVCFMRPCKRSPSCYQRSLSYSCQRAPAGLKLCIFSICIICFSIFEPSKLFFQNWKTHLFEKLQLVNHCFPAVSVTVSTSS